MQAARRTSSQTGRMGQRLQKAAVVSRNVRASIPSFDCERLPKIQSTKTLSHLDPVSLRFVVELPHDKHRHLCLLAEVVPFLTILLAQTPHFGPDTAHPCPRSTFLAKNLL